RFSGRSHLVRVLRRPALVMALLIVAIVWTNPWHHLFYASDWLDTSGPAAEMTHVPGPLYWVHIGWNYLLVALGALAVAVQLRSGHGLYRQQARMVMVAVLVPWGVNLLYLARVVPLAHLDPTPMLFTASALAFS